jgi:hypothetical protein
MNLSQLNPHLLVGAIAAAPNEQSIDRNRQIIPQEEPTKSAKNDNEGSEQTTEQIYDQISSTKVSSDPRVIGSDRPRFDMKAEVIGLDGWHGGRGKQQSRGGHECVKGSE